MAQTNRVMIGPAAPSSRAKMSFGSSAPQYPVLTQRSNAVFISGNTKANDAVPEGVKPKGDEIINTPPPFVKEEGVKPNEPIDDDEEATQELIIPDDDDDETDILPAVREMRPRFPYAYQSELSSYVILTLVIGGIYFLAYIVTLFSIRDISILIYNQYPRFDLKPGSLVSDRLSYFVIIMAIAATRIVVPFTTFWMLRPISQSWKRLLNFVLYILFIAVDVVVIASLAISWGFLCNNGTLGFALCNDLPRRYCNVYQGSFPTRCIPEPVTLTSADLHPTTPFYVLFGSECVLLLLGIVMTIVNRKLDNVAQEYRLVSAFK